MARWAADFACACIALWSGSHCGQLKIARIHPVPERSPTGTLACHHDLAAGYPPRGELLFCRDSRAMNLPSLCHNGCTETQALNAARSLCLQICGHINCNTLADFGSC